MEKTIGFIGTGVMGKSMAGHLLSAGYKTLVYNRTPERAKDLVECGAIQMKTVAELAQEADIIITMVGYPQDVEQIYFGEQGIIKHAKPGTYVIDMTTSSPLLAEKIYREALNYQLHALDAPVSGGDIGAKNATLSIMVGGDEDVFEAMRPVFETLGNNVILQGKAGAGQHTKMCNQITVAANMMGVCEAVLYAEKSGLDPQKMLQSVGTGAAASWSLNNLGPRMIARDFEPGFYVKHFIKDMKIALEAAADMNLWMPGLSLAKTLYEQLADEGYENKGTHALYVLLEQGLRE